MGRVESGKGERRDWSRRALISLRAGASDEEGLDCCCLSFWLGVDGR